MAGSDVAGTREMLDFCRGRGHIADIQRAYDRMVKSGVKYRLVIYMPTLGAE